MWFNSAKGYGFLQCDDGKEIFVHYTAIEDDGFRKLSEGEEVEFDIVTGSNGKPQADGVHKTGVWRKVKLPPSSSSSSAV